MLNSFYFFGHPVPDYLDATDPRRVPCINLVLITGYIIFLAMHVHSGNSYILHVKCVTCFRTRIYEFMEVCSRLPENSVFGRLDHRVITAMKATMISRNGKIQDVGNGDENDVLPGHHHA